MRILLDNNVPAYVLGMLSKHQASTAYREGWHELANGKLLEAAEKHGFSLLLTLDGGFKHQQNLSVRTISVALLEPNGQSRAAMERVVFELLAKLSEIENGTLIVISSRA